MNKVVIALSGGMDSATLCAYYVNKGYSVFPVSFEYGSKHNKYERQAALSLCDYWNLDLKLVSLDFISDLFESNLLLKGGDIPEGHYESKNMSKTVVPGRNVIFASIMMGYAWSIGTDTIALGVHAGDHCLQEGSLISTCSGLKQIQDLKPGDDIYSYNPASQQVEKDKVVLLAKKGIPSEVLEITSRSGERIRVTDEHKMYKILHTNFDCVMGFTKTVHKVQAKDLQEKDSLLTFTTDELINNSLNKTFLSVFKETVDPWVKLGYEIDSNEDKIFLRNPINRVSLKPINSKLSIESLVRLCAWYITEGFTNKVKKGQSNFSSAISQSASINPENTEEIQELLKEAMGELRTESQLILNTWIEDEGERIQIQEIREFGYYISGTLSAIFQSCGKKSREKIIPEWLWNLVVSDPSLRKLFLVTCLKGDGCKFKLEWRGETYSYISFSEELLKQMTFLFRISGFSVSQGSATTIEITKPFVKKYQSTLGNLSISSIKKIERISNFIPVYDIQVEKNHNFFAGATGGILVSNSIYEDCRAGFISAMNAAIINGSGDRVRLEAPFLYMNKTDILEIGYSYNVPVPYRLTRTCYKDQELSCGKCGSDIERLEAFANMGISDPIKYEK